MPIDWLLERMTEWPDRPAIIWHDREFSYQWLLDHVARWQIDLDTHGVPPNSVVALFGDYSPVSCALMLALIQRPCVVVPLSSAVHAEQVEFMSVAEVQYSVVVDAHDAWRVDSHDRTVTNALTQTLIDQSNPGLVLFSSGSTGKSKAALHNFVRLLEKFKTRRHCLRTLTFLLLDHIGGINTLLYTLSNGGTVVATESRDPDAICQTIERHRVELVPTTPTFLNMLLLSEAYKRYDLSSLKLITYGTEAMPETTLQRVNEVFPHVRLLQTYGLSELGILRSKSKDPRSLWVKVGGEGFETKVVDGILWIRAQSAMLGYLNAPSPFDADGWLCTGDIVEVEGGYLRILGRQSEIINVGGQKVYPAEVESVLMQMDNVRDVTVAGEKNPIMGQIVVARFNLLEPENATQFKRRVREFCRDRLAPYKIPAKIEVVESEQYSARFKKMRRQPVPALS